MSHIQNYSEASAVEHHWAFSDRLIPCTVDAGSCKYLDVVYHAHDVGVTYSAIFWATVLGIIFVWALVHRLRPGKRADEEYLVPVRASASRPQGGLTRFSNALASYRRQHLLPEFARPIFGRTTRLQVLILLIIAGYLAVFSFVGIVYNTWITPVKKHPGLYSTRTSLGPWADRIGILAYALTPLSILLSSRESLLSLLTGLPYQNFNFLHRWLGYIIVVQSTLHTIGWCLIEGWLYQPQPVVGQAWIKQLYMIWGVIAMILLFLLFALSTPWAIRLTGYEFFRKSHYVLAMVYIGACIGHWKQLSCYLIPALIVWLLDRSARIVRTVILHYNVMADGEVSFAPAKAETTLFADPVNGDVVRLDFTHPHDAWAIGQHFYLCFPQSSIWQSHPFTPLSLPIYDEGANGVQHSYIFRAKHGETKRIAQLAAIQSQHDGRNAAQTSVILTGPYGENITTHLTQDVNILCIAGGTGITYVLPVLLNLTQQPRSVKRKVTFIWAIRQKADVAWVKPEIDSIRHLAKSIDLIIRIYVTREAEGQFEGSCEKDEFTDHNLKSAHDKTTATTILESSNQTPDSSSAASTSAAHPCCGPPSDSFAIRKTAIPAADPHDKPIHRHPDLGLIVDEFMNEVSCGRTTVYASGPGRMISELRSIVAQCNDGAKVWRADEKYNVELLCDDRLEW
jgi:predicted ferric reductase